jgi:PLP dependent protein
MMRLPFDLRRDTSAASTAGGGAAMPDGADRASTDPRGASAEPGEPAALDAVANLHAVRARIQAAATRVGRSPHAVTFVAVSKTFPAEAVIAVREAGHADFGESRAKELQRKAAAVGAGVRWHFVGRLQRNKVRDVVGVASLIHSVDRLPLAEAIAEEARRLGRVQRVLVQVNVGDDPDKAGCAVADAVGFVAKVRALEGLACEGLMTIPPLDADPRPLFARLREVRDDVRMRFPEVQHLSMGMTHDFEVAVEEGATIVRVGEAVFGPRTKGDGTQR